MPEENTTTTTQQGGGGGKPQGNKPSSGSSETGGQQGGGKFGGGTGGGMTQGQGGKPGNPFMSGTTPYQPGGEFFDFQARPVAGSSPLLNYAGALSTGLPGAGQGGMAGAYGAAGNAAGMLGNAAQMFGNMGQLNPYYQQMVGAAGQLGQLPGQTQEAMNLYRSMPEIAGRQVTGANVENDPAVKAAQAKFQEVMAPMIKDAAGLAGLGKSGVMTNALASQQAQTLLPLIQDSMGREERGIDRLLGGTQAGASGLFSGGQQSMQQLLSQIGTYGQAGAAQQQGEQAGAAGLSQVGGQMGGISQLLAGLGGQEQNMLMNAIGGLSGLGGEFRGIEQEMLNAPYEEQMRMYTEALNSLYGPLGMIPGLTGSSSVVSGKKG